MLRSPIIIRQVSGDSMAPTLKHHRLIIGWRFFKPRIGQIVIAQHNSREVVKRITKIDGSHVYLHGDNHLNSTDSRTYGPADMANIIALVM